MPRGRPKKNVEPSSNDSNPATNESEPPKAAPAKPTKDAVRIEMMKRIYVARDPEATMETWLHHPDCKDEGGKEAVAKCAALGCGGFSGLDVGEMIDSGWWNSLPGDH